MCNSCTCPADEKEESILGSIPLLSFRVAAVQPSDNISRKHTFKVSAWLCRGLVGMEHWGSGDARGVPAAPSSCFLGDGAWSKSWGYSVQMCLLLGKLRHEWGKAASPRSSLPLGLSCSWALPLGVPCCPQPGEVLT